MNTITINKELLAPSKVVCIGRNYAEHIKELDNEIPEQAVIFVKPNSAICAFIYSDLNEPIHYESEISFIMKNGVISAVGFGLDLTKRALQSRLKTQGLPWERAKAFDKSAVFSDFVSFSGNIDTLSMQLLINDKLVQQASVSLMIYKPLQIIKEVVSFMSLLDGDIVMTGTPKGVGELFADDCFVGRIFDGETLLIEKKWIVK